MTLRGRLTLAALTGLTFATGWGVGRDLASGPPSLVALPAPELSVASQPPEEVPAWVLGRLPPGARPDEAVGSEDLAALLRGADRVVERVEDPEGGPPLEVEYTIDPELTSEVGAILARGRVALGHVIVLDPRDGRVLAYASTDPAAFPASRAYPTASLMKVVTAAAALRSTPEVARRNCHFLGSPYRLTRARLKPPRRGNIASFRKALATSNNQCFAQIGVHDLGEDAVVAEMERVGMLEAPAPGHEAGRIDPVESELDLGKLASGLAGSRIAPLAAARLAAALVDGQLVAPHWVERVTDAHGRVLSLPETPPRPVWTSAVAGDLRSMLVDTTLRGTARRAFRDRRGRPLLQTIRVAGKTGSLTGHDPDGHYEWFIGVAPADEPRVAVATLVVNGKLWWRSASQIAAEVLRAVFCDAGRCRVDAADARLDVLETAQRAASQG
jgi:penicillin-binding protein A